SNGEVASKIACEVIVDQVSAGLTLSDSIAHAHKTVLAEIRARNAESNMGTTVVALQLNESRYEIAWVGDSRAYLFDGKLTQLTKDHSAVNELLDRGVITPDKVAGHPQRHALSRSLGVSDLNQSEASTLTGTLAEGQQLLLCTDGLTDELTDSMILRELQSNQNPEKQVQSLLDSALAQGGSDNLTIVVVGDPLYKPAVAKPGADLEVTQDLGEPSSLAVPRKAGYLKYIWLPLLVVALIAMTVWS
ncbi:MAG: protein phosphatase 2C domain-containing protein, partial [Pseudomonadota bacterium]